MKKRRAGRRLRHAVHGPLIVALYHLFRLIPLDAASALGGWIGRTFGPHLARSRRVRRNLHLVFPDMPDPEVRRIEREMWDNLLRTFVEFAHLDTIAGEHETRVEWGGLEHRDAAVAAARPIVAVTAHCGNWEMAVAPLAAKRTPCGIVYRTANIPMIDRLIRRVRVANPIELLPKSGQGTRGMVRILRAGGCVGILVDQKLRQGIEAPFLGRPAMTSSLPAEMALKYDATVLPVHVERLARSRFRIVFDAPLDLPRTGNTAADVEAITARINDVVGAWITARPGQWLWLHRRWLDS